MTDTSKAVVAELHVTRWRETMRAQMAPDVYDGPNCDQHRPQWAGSADGDKDGDGPIGNTLTLDANTFPPGTKVRIEEPECPHCQEVPSLMDWPGQSGRWECGCDFDWHEWACDTYS